MVTRSRGVQAIVDARPELILTGEPLWLQRRLREWAIATVSQAREAP